jgi:hypothetical protein
LTGSDSTRSKLEPSTAHLADEEIGAYEELNLDMTMTKPFDFDELQDAMPVPNNKAYAFAEV